jgi:hypothetical protein
MTPGRRSSPSTSLSGTRAPPARSQRGGLVSTPPGGGYEGDYVFTIPERPSNSFQLQNDALHRTADPGYFSAMQIPLIKGRFFTDQERLIATTT